MEKAWETALSTRTDLEKYGDNSLVLFALGLKFGLEDLESIAANALTDGSDDKKCDLVYVDTDEGFAVIAQCYKSTKLRKEAPANKASDLNTAVSWLLQRPIAELPDGLKSAAQELRSALQESTVTTLHIWYVHNLNESKNVLNELKTVESTAQAALEKQFPEKKVKLQALEVGDPTLSEWYSDALSPILVDEKFEIPVQGGFEITGLNWSAYITAIPAKFLHRVYKRHKTRLFSANVRDYLGSRQSDANINFGIKNTAEKEPYNFWVFNNGLTVLVNKYDRKEKGNKIFLVVDGISVVNGAQTTGAIGSLRKQPADTALVPARFVQTSDKDILFGIIRYNNSQNKVTASDFRSTDPIQKRLREQMEKIPQAEYEGGRRGGHEDVIRRRPDLLPSYTVGQALAALQQDPVTAYNQKTNIWVSDTFYSKYFNEHTTAPHIVFAYSLLRSVEAKKMRLVEKTRRSDASMTVAEKDQTAFFRHRGSTFLLTAAISGCLETVLLRSIPNLFRLSFGESISPKEAQAIWDDIVETVTPFCMQLQGALTDGLKSKERVNEAIQRFQSLVLATVEVNRDRYKAFASKIISK